MKTALFIVLGMAVALSLGCTARVTSGVRITPEAAAFIAVGTTTRAELIREIAQGNLGEPYWKWPRERAIAYVWTTTNGAQVGVDVPAYCKWFFDSGRKDAPSWVQQSDWAFCVIFDENERVVRHRFIKEGSRESLKAAVEQWLRTPSR